MKMEVLHEETQKYVKIGNETKQSFKVETGVRQSCIISSFFYIIIEYLLS